MAGKRGMALVAVGLAVALLAGAVMASHWLFDAESVQAMARERVHAATGRDLRMESLSLRLLPAPALRARRVALSNPDWAKESQLFEADQVDVRLSWRALLTGRIAPGAVLIRQGSIHLETDARGKRSWDLSSDADRVRRMSWLDLTELRMDAVDVSFRNPAGQQLWRVQAIAATAGPGWKHARLEADVVKDSQRLRLEADIADLSRAGQAGASSTGRIAARLPSASATLSGVLPLSLNGNAAADLDVEAKSAADLLAWFHAVDGPGAPAAPLSLRARLSGGDDTLTADIAHFGLGHTEASGQLSLRRQAQRARLEGRVDVPRLDWAEFAREAGRPPPAAIPASELFRRDPLPWHALAALDDVDLQLALSVGTLRLRSGIALEKLQAQLHGSGSRLAIAPFSMQLLGGNASGKLALDSRRQAADLTLDASGIMLERWFAERGRKLPVAGGPMRITAALKARGATQRELAASVDGLITVRGGDTVIRSEKAGNAESLLTDLFPLFSERDAGQLRLQCFAARIPLRQGRAGQTLAGARSDASQLLTQGVVDLRRQSLDLRGRVRARNGISLGVALVSGDIAIAGPLTKPKMALDPSSPGALARIGAAVLTGGLSLIATAAWDAANSSDHPCEAALRDGRADE